MSTGIFSSFNFTTDSARKSFAAQFIRLMPNGNAPLFGMTGMLAEETALAVEHGFFSKTMLFPQLICSAAGQTATDTVFTVTTTINVLAGMVMRVNNAGGENVIINNVLSPTQVQVIRGVGTAPPAAIGANLALFQVGNAFEESSVRPAALAINPVRITNLTQIFRNTWAISGSVAATEMLVGETNISENRTDCAAFHGADIEKALFWGQRGTSFRNGQPIRMLDGLFSIINNLAFYPPSYTAVNVNAAGATTNYTQFEGFLDPCFNQTTDPKYANERLLFVGGVARRVINNIGRTNGTYFLQHGQTDFGLQFDTFRIARGTFRMIEHPLFNSNAAWAAVAFAVDLPTFNVAYLGNRKTMNKEFNSEGDMVADNGIDAVGGTLTTELTCLVKNPPACAVITGLTASAVG